MREWFFDKTLAAFALALCASAAYGQERAPMSIIDLLEVPLLKEPQLSADGSRLLYVLEEADWKANKRIGHIWRVNTDGSGTTQLTRGAKGERSPRWSPDGTLIAFLARRDEEEATEEGGKDQQRGQIYLLRNDGGEAWPLTRHPTPVLKISWSPTGEHVYFIAADEKTEEEKQRKKAHDDVFPFDEDYEHEHLWRVSVDDGKEERLSEGDFSIRSYRLSRDGMRLAYHRAPSPLIDDADEGEVWAALADGTEGVRLTRNAIWERAPEPSPDGAWVLYLADCNGDFEPYYNRNIFLVPTGGGPSRMLLGEIPYEVQEATWSADGRSIFFTANTGVRSELFRVDVATEELEQLTRGDHRIRHWSYEPRAGRHAVSLGEGDNAGDVWMLSDEGADPGTRVTRLYDYLARDFDLPRQEAIRWKGKDGVTVEGLLFYPTDYQLGERYPLVVQTHGGPAMSSKFGFPRGVWLNYVQVLTAMGYAVLQPNYRGSTGYGDDYLRDMVGHYYRQSHLDVMAGVDHLIELGIADGSRMVKMGWSAGGHMTNKIITHTDRFKAASSGAGAVNWISMYGQSDVRIYRTPWFGGTPWEQNAPTEVYWDHSPLKDISRVTTPTLVLVGEKDVRVPPPQSVELYRALKANGVPTRLYIAPREPHIWRELRHQLFKVNAELEWFEKYARGRDYTWETPPDEGSADQSPEEATDMSGAPEVRESFRAHPGKRRDANDVTVVERR